MTGYRVWKAVRILVLVVMALLVFGFLTKYLWNWLMPGIFGLRTITFVQALGLVILSKILLGGVHKHGPGGGGRRGWKRHMAERWARMSPEERARFKEGMRRRRDCGWGPGEWGPRGPWGAQGEWGPRGEKPEASGERSV